mmetsp:Transcript_4859/g.8360  ORF Transcript_4859/g.8360 Transcript_4859/m.8360 type:complete len:107 (+) Transcript_4859:1063-1383(+)
MFNCCDDSKTGSSNLRFLRCSCTALWISSGTDGPQSHSSQLQASPDAKVIDARKLASLILQLALFTVLIESSRGCLTRTGETKQVRQRPAAECVPRVGFYVVWSFN